MTDRLSPLDVAFLCLENAAPMHLGAVLVLGTPAPDGARAVAGVLADRASRVARLRQRVRSTWLPPGGAVWAPAADFRAEDHVRSHDLGGGDWQDLAALAGRLMGEPLDLTRPPWELHVIGGLDGRRSAVLAKLHHALCDGAGAVRLGLELIDGGSDRPDQHRTADTGTAGPAPQAAAATAAAWPQPVLRAAAAVVATAGGMLTDLPGRARQARSAAGIGSSVLRNLRLPQAASPLVGTGSAARRLVMLRLDAHDLRRIRECHGGTTHDVLLAVLSGALRQWLQALGHPVDDRPIRALIPVSQRARSAAGGGNRLSGYLCELPVGEPDPVVRLHAVRAAMDRNKAAGPEAGPGAVALLADLVPPAAHRVLTPLAARHPSLLFNLVVTTVRLPPVALTLGGAAVQEIYPVVPLAPGHAIGVAFAHDRDAVHVGLHTDTGSAHDIDKLCDALQSAVAELLVQQPSALAAQAREGSRQGSVMPPGQASRSVSQPVSRAPAW